MARILAFTSIHTMASLQQGQEGYQLTWMDAKVGDWVVTPRRGKAVEINALWYNALRLLAGWVREEQGDEAARHLAKHAEQARTSFNARFWYAEGGYLYDVIDGPQGEDAARPNQVFALSLRHPILDQARWERILAVVRQHLLTPVGLRSLAPGHPDYKPKYDGDLRARDAAYHQGTVWPWLIGPFIDAWLRVYPEDRAGARNLLKGLVPQLNEAGLGTICEIFDAEEPFTPRGCIAQAWSVAEMLRCWVKPPHRAWLWIAMDTKTPQIMACHGIGGGARSSFGGFRVCAESDVSLQPMRGNVQMLPLLKRQGNQGNVDPPQ